MFAKIYGMKIHKLLLAAAALLAPVLVSAEEWVIPRTTYYISAEMQKMPDFPPPPTAGSAADREDLAGVLDWQNRRTPAQCAAAGGVPHADFESFFGDLSPFPEPLPAEAAAILKRIKTETDGIAADIKDKFRRPRPFLRDARLEPCLGRIGGLAYPSGHATISRLLALMLADLVPEKRKVFLARAEEAGLDRVIGGVHHPADVEAGRELADRLYPRYRRSKAFAADMKVLRGLIVKKKADKRIKGKTVAR